MEPIYEPEDVDFVISSGRWSAEVLAEVAEFFRQCDDEAPSLVVNEASSNERKTSASSEVIQPVAPVT